MNSRLTNTLVERWDYETDSQGKRGRGRPKKTWKETLRKHMNVRRGAKPSAVTLYNSYS